MRTNDEHAPFLLLSVRGEEAAADDEYLAIMRFAGLDESDLRRIRLTHEELAAIGSLMEALVARWRALGIDESMSLEFPD